MIGVQVTYIYHSGLLFSFDDIDIIVDYYKDSNGEHGIIHDLAQTSNKPTYFLSSHFHQDHFNPEILNLGFKQAKFILSKDIFRRRKKLLSNVDCVFLDKGEWFEDHLLKIKAYGSTDIGVSFAIFKEKFKLFHAGDLNNWHWKEESDEQEWQGYEKHFLTELEAIYKDEKEFDLVCFPLDPRLGQEFMLGASQFIQKIRCKAFCPIHFWGDFEKIQKFAPIAEHFGVNFIKIKHYGQVFSLN